MSVTPIATEDLQTVFVQSDLLHIRDFVESDPSVVSTIRDADDPVTTLHHILTMGAQGHRVARATVDGAVLTDTVDRLTASVETTVGDALGNLREATDALLDDNDGAIARALAGFTAKFNETVSNQLDPDSKKSLLGSLQSVLQGVASDERTKLTRLFDPSAQDSPLAKVRDELGRQFHTEIGDVADQVRQLSERLAAQTAAEQAERQVFDRTAIKGTKFEDLLHALLEPIAAAQGDLAQPTGRESGAAGSQVGDVVTSLNPDHTFGRSAHIVWEAKDKKMSLRAILAELNEAMANREAGVGVAVFASETQAPSTMPFIAYGSKAIVVVDKNDPDMGALRLAYSWARLMACREMLAERPEIDVDRIDGLIQEARRALGRVTQVRRFHSAARKGVDEAGQHVDGIARDIAATLDSLESEIARAMQLAV
jgi:hypothetical protein